KMGQHKQQQGLTRLGREMVDVIQDQDRVVLEQALKGVEETSQHLLVLVGMPGPIRLNRAVQARIDTRQSSDERGKEARRVILCLLTGKPGYRLRGRGSPFGQ